MSNNTEDDFFQGKRPWSKIKDKILKGYMPPYLRKVSKLGRQILLVDGYAGPGEFDDQEEGSPLIMCSAAEEHVPQQYHALFVNRKAKYHKKLTQALENRGWLLRAEPLLADANVFLERLSHQLRDQTIFVYIDPFGLRGCEFNTLEPFLNRNIAFSTEIVLNVSMPITHRLAAANKVAKGEANDPRIKSNHKRMTKVFGGTYWQDIYFSNLQAEEKEIALMSEYNRRIAQYLPYTGSCPVRETSTSRIKYFVTFASRHSDAMLVMNDEMCKAYFGQMHEADYTGTLFEKLDWQDMRFRSDLDKIVLREVSLQSGLTRSDLWFEIVKKHFMEFTASDYRRSIKHLVKEEKLSVEYTSTRRLNDNCKLFLPK